MIKINGKTCEVVINSHVLDGFNQDQDDGVPGVPTNEQLNVWKGLLKSIKDSVKGFSKADTVTTAVGGEGKLLHPLPPCLTSVAGSITRTYLWNTLKAVQKAKEHQSKQDGTTSLLQPKNSKRSGNRGSFRFELDDEHTLLISNLSAKNIQDLSASSEI